MLPKAFWHTPKSRESLLLPSVLQRPVKYPGWKWHPGWERPPWCPRVPLSVTVPTFVGWARGFGQPSLEPCSVIIQLSRFNIFNKAQSLFYLLTAAKPRPRVPSAAAGGDPAPSSRTCIYCFNTCVPAAYPPRASGSSNKPCSSLFPTLSLPARGSGAGRQHGWSGAQ